MRWNVVVGRGAVAAVVCAGAVVAGSGCATAVRGTKQAVRVESEPSGATVRIDEKEYTTPFEVVLERKAKHTVTVSKEGYQPLRFVLEGKIDGAAIGQFVLPGGSALIAGDVATGGAKNYNQLAKIKLQKLPAGQLTAEPITMYEFRGQLLTTEEYAKAKAELDAERRREMAQPKVSR